MYKSYYGHVFLYFNRNRFCFPPSINRNKICGSMYEKFLQLPHLRVGLFYTHFHTKLSVACSFTGRQRKSPNGAFGGELVFDE